MKSFFELKDKGSSFWDVSQGAGVVVDKVAPLEQTATVMQAERDGVLIRVPKADGIRRYKAQLAEDAKNNGTIAQEVDEDGNIVASDAKAIQAGTDLTEEKEVPASKDLAPDPKTETKKK